MKRIFLFLILLIAPTLLVGQVPSVKIKVREKSGFLGLGDPRFVELRLSNREQKLPLTDQNVNSDTQYVFLCLPSGDWKFDSDFIEEELVNLAVSQDGQLLPITWNSEFSATDTSVLVGFPKQIRIHEPILFVFSFDGNADSSSLKIPMELWPGYALFRDLAGRLNRALSDENSREAIRLCEEILGIPVLSIYPGFSELRNKRTEVFQSLHDLHWRRLRATIGDGQVDLKTKIANLDTVRPVFAFIQDSVQNHPLGITTSDSAIATLLTSSKDVLAWIGKTRDSLQLALDEKNVRWIYEGSVAGRSGFQYQTVLEAVAYGFSSLDFQDTMASSLNCSISEEMRANLAKNNLTDSYETFIRLTNERYKDRQTLFTPEFLANVGRDSGSFRLPLYAILKAVNDYYAGEFESARAMTFAVFQGSYDADLSSRFDQMRIMIQVRSGLHSGEAVQLLEDARSMERTDPDAAGELYRRATVIASDFAYASFALGQYYNRQGDAIRAQTFFVRAYEIDSLYLSAYRESFNIYRRTGNYKPMIEVLILAINKGNDYWETQSNLGLAYMGDGDPARAIQHYERALTINPQSYTTNIQLGLAYQSVKNYQRAREYFNNAINIDPLRQEAVEYLTRLNELQRSGK
ncbi:MAG TPA: tetratricopeptide repeat protein [Bacteroidota bacterium]